MFIAFFQDHVFCDQITSGNQIQVFTADQLRVKMFRQISRIARQDGDIDIATLQVTYDLDRTCLFQPEIDLGEGTAELFQYPRQHISCTLGRDAQIDLTGFLIENIFEFFPEVVIDLKDLPG